jgi:hypothetical protein
MSKFILFISLLFVTFGCVPQQFNCDLASKMSIRNCKSDHIVIDTAFSYEKEIDIRKTTSNIYKNLTKNSNNLDLSTTSKDLEGGTLQVRGGTILKNNGPMMPRLNVSYTIGFFVEQNSCQLFIKDFTVEYKDNRGFPQKSALESQISFYEPFISKSWVDYLNKDMNTLKMENTEIIQKSVIYK